MVWHSTPSTDGVLARMRGAIVELRQPSSKVVLRTSGSPIWCVNEPELAAFTGSSWIIELTRRHWFHLGRINDTENIHVSKPHSSAGKKSTSIYKQINDYLDQSPLPHPSFVADGPVDLGLLPHLVHLRDVFLKATEELND
jgi:hypothetical protein